MIFKNLEHVMTRIRGTFAEGNNNNNIRLLDLQTREDKV